VQFVFSPIQFQIQTIPPLANSLFPKNKSTDNTVTIDHYVTPRILYFDLDIYVCSVSAAHNVSAKDKWLAFISTTAETNDHEKELAPAFNLIGPVEEKFIYAQDVLHPKEGTPTDNVRHNRK